jgi:hypothetical protein
VNVTRISVMVLFALATIEVASADSLCTPDPAKASEGNKLCMVPVLCPEVGMCPPMTRPGDTDAVKLAHYGGICRAQRCLGAVSAPGPTCVVMQEWPESAPCPTIPGKDHGIY